ncbi:MAG: LysR family transcriptional regulator substrate-binding protein [Silvanigrellaceae bacterium]|nr:LysR family transcriptional regulator substrate-binding protein [Silvanigrellaceae bacterium]
MSQFLREYPHIQFTLNEKNSLEVLQALHAGAIDVGVISQDPYLSQKEELTEKLKVHVEIFDQIDIIAAQEHPLVKMRASLKVTGKSLLPIHMSCQPMILSQPGSSLREVIDRELRRASLRPHVIMNLHCEQSILEMVSKNIGLGIVSRLALGNTSSVEVLDIEGLSFKRSLQICTLSDRELSPASTKFVEFLSQWVKRQ